MTCNELTECLRILGLTQVEVAQLLSVNVRTVQRWALGTQEVPGPAEQALRAWQGLHERGLAWRPDEQSLTFDDREQIAVVRSHAVDLDALLKRVEARGGPIAPWDVDLDRCRATLGRMQVSFCKLRNGGFALQSYRRSDDFGADPQRDRALIEDAVACIARAYLAHSMTIRTRLALTDPSLHKGALYLWDQTLSPPVVVKLECDVLREALSLPEELPLPDDKCRLLVATNKALVTRIAEDALEQQRAEPGPLGMRVVPLAVADLRPRRSAFALNVLSLNVKWGTA